MKRVLLAAAGALTLALLGLAWAVWRTFPRDSGSVRARGHAATVRMLVKHGSDVDRRNNRDQSPIAGAIFKGEDEVVRVLRDAGADLDAGTPSARQAAEMFERTDLLA